MTASAISIENCRGYINCSKLWSYSVAVVTQESLKKSLNALFIGAAISAILYGSATQQTYRYFRMYPKDTLGIKVIIGALWIFDTLHTICTIHMCQYYLVVTYFSPLAVTTLVWSISGTIGSGAVLTAIANGVYARRIYIIGNKNIFLTIFTIVLPIVQFGFASAVFVELLLNRRFAIYTNFLWIITAAISSAAATDVALSTSIAWFLHVSRTGFERTNTLIDKLMAYTVGTGLLTSMVAVSALICDFIYMGIFFVLKKFYSNALLVWLNSRRPTIDMKASEMYDVGSLSLRYQSAVTPRSEIHIERITHTEQGRRSISMKPLDVTTSTINFVGDSLDRTLNPDLNRRDGAPYAM
ncbi:hypothetical protein BDQ17DRAFT_178215 [Cyathus striatus]|nr:hypothetical protein BDQ17DRAFT_178215 [Cyathus striatus]